MTRWRALAFVLLLPCAARGDSLRELSAAAGVELLLRASPVVRGLKLPDRDKHVGQRPVLQVSPQVQELSGSVIEARGILWTHGDSGTGPWIGRTLLSTLETETVEVTGAENVDWESMAMGPGGELWILDTGDNHRKRSEVAAHCLGSPDPGARSLPVLRTIRFRYPDGPRDVEASYLQGGRIYLIEKTLWADAGLYSIDAGESAPGTQVARREGAIEGANLFTDASLSPSGRLYLLAYEGVFETGPSLLGLRRARSIAAGDWGQVESLSALGDLDLLVGREDGLVFQWRRGSFVFPLQRPR